MTAPLFLIGPDETESLGVGSVFRLGGAEGRHAAAVQRLAPGERLDLSDGTGRYRWRTVVIASTGDSVDVEVVERSVDDIERATPRIVLVQALAKGGRDEQAIEAATELGVHAVVPWQAERSIVHWRGQKTDRGREKWQNVVRAAAKQSRRTLVPDVRPLLTGATLPASDRARQVLVLHEEASVPLSTWRPADGTVELWLVVGPEGGITAGELDALDRTGADAVRLGPGVLRSSTAGPAALAVLQSRLGRWG